MPAVDRPGFTSEVVPDGHSLRAERPYSTQRRGRDTAHHQNQATSEGKL
jgi:hypothetical protein